MNFWNLISLKKHRIGLLPRILIAILLGIVFGRYMPDWAVRIFATFNALFNEFLGFIIPLIIVGLVVPAIADIGRSAGKMLLVTTIVASCATLFSGFLSYFTGAALFPGMITTGVPLEEVSQNNSVTPFFTISIPPLMNVMTALFLAFTVGIGLSRLYTTALKDVMNDFAAGKYDLLLSTTIIESGIDMPSVNTMIIHRADMFGLAQLYQLRGRIGRSKVRGYCYFTIPAKKKLKPVAEKRLMILSALDTLGAGFSLASHDMDIRGSGNVLGTEQSGHIKDVGIALYHHMLEEEIVRQKAAMQHQKANESATVFAADDWAPQITTGIPIMIPENYVKDLGVRLGLYKRIGALKNNEEILDMREELIDRFGPIPSEVENLLTTIEIKQICYAANIAKIDAGAKGDESFVRRCENPPRPKAFY